MAIKYLKDAGHKKCIKLNVSVASHSNVMINAIDEFKKELDMINMSMPNNKIIHNVDNESSNDIAELKNKLLNQLTNPVRWSNTMEYIKKHNGIVIECGPNNVLSGLARSNGIEEVYSTFSKNFIDEIKSAL